MIDKTFLTFKIIFTAFSLFLVLTFFMPTISLDRYVEYEFNYGYYDPEYQAYSEPFARKISPLDIVSSLSLDRKSVFEIQNKATEAEKSIKARFESGEISHDEMIELIASNHDINKSVISKIAIGDGPYAMLSAQQQTFSLLLIIFYSLFFLFFVVNLLNLILDRKMLYMASYQTSWFMALVWLLNIIFTFAFSFTTSASLLETGQLVEMTTICGAPTALSYATFFALIAYIFISKSVNENYFMLSFLESEKTHDGRKKSNYLQIEKYLSKNKPKEERSNNETEKE